MSALTQAVQRLHEARVSEAAQRAEVKALRDRFEAEHTLTFEKLAATTAVREAAETLVREWSVVEFTQNGTKAPAPGVTVVESSKLKYDAEKAFAWAHEHKLCLSLDTKAFEKTAKASPLPFVTTEVTPMVRIATDLGPALGGA